MRTDGLFYDDWMRASADHLGGIEGLAYEEWTFDVARSLCCNFDRSSIDAIPLEYKNLFMNPARDSLKALWMKTSRSNSSHIGIGRIRQLVEFLVTSNCEYKISPKDYSKWISQLIIICDGDHSTGSLNFDMFIDRFHIWYASRAWKARRNLSPVDDVIQSWKFLDVGDCGVLPISCLKDHLLPYAFRVLYPESESDDSELKAKWIELMTPVFVGTKSQWINHWKEFIKLDFKRFIVIVSDDESCKTLAVEAIDFLEIDYSEEYLLRLEDLMSSSGISKLQRARVFCLWLVTLHHNNYIYEQSYMLEEKIRPEPTITSIADFRQYCLFMWTGGASVLPSEASHFDKWVNSMIDNCSMKNGTEGLLVFRSEFLSRFLTSTEIDTIWCKFVGDGAGRIVPSDLRHILKGVYAMRNFTGCLPGEWIVDKWFAQFVSYVRARYSVPGQPLYVTRMAFSWALPLVVATIHPKRYGDVPLSICNIWPLELDQEIVYSEPVLRNLLRQVWDKTVPSDLNLPCQQWWLDRCISIFAREGKGITRDTFYSIFVSQDELYRICMQKLDAKFLSTILTDPKCITSNCYEEFFLIANVSDTSAELDKEVFKYAYPLWFAAHGSY